MTDRQTDRHPNCLSYIHARSNILVCYQILGRFLKVKPPVLYETHISQMIEGKTCTVSLLIVSLTEGV